MRPMIRPVEIPVRERARAVSPRLWCARAGVVAVSIVLAVSACRGNRAPRPLRLGVAIQPPAALVFVAEDIGYIRDEGIALTSIPYVSGKRALEALLAGEIDVATISEVPLAVEAPRNPPVRIIAAISETDNDPRIVARRGAGILVPGDLRGKRIGTQRGSAVHFFLHLFLTNLGIGPRDADVVFMPPEEMVGALVDGRIDAFSMREPFVSQATQSLGNRVVVFQDPGRYLRTEILVARAEFVAEHPDVVASLVWALFAARDYVEDNAEEARAIVARRMQLSPAAIAEEWKRYRFAIELDQALVISLEDAVRWAMQAGISQSNGFPNVLHLIDPSVLELVDPRAVRLAGGSPWP